MDFVIESRFRGCASWRHAGNYIATPSLNKKKVWTFAVQQLKRHSDPIKAMEVLARRMKISRFPQKILFNLTFEQDSFRTGKFFMEKPNHFQICLQVLRAEKILKSSVFSVQINGIESNNRAVWSLDARLGFFLNENGDRDVLNVVDLLHGNSRAVSCEEGSEEVLYFGSEFFNYVYPVTNDRLIVYKQAKNRPSTINLLGIDYSTWKFTLLDSTIVGNSIFSNLIAFDTQNSSKFFIDPGAQAYIGQIIDDRLILDYTIGKGRPIAMQLTGNRLRAFQQIRERNPVQGIEERVCRWQFCEYNLENPQRNRIENVQMITEEDNFFMWIRFVNKRAHAWFKDRLYMADNKENSYQFHMFDAITLRWSKLKYSGWGIVTGLSFNDDGVLLFSVKTTRHEIVFDRVPRSEDEISFLITYRHALSQPERLSTLVWSSISRQRRLKNNAVYKSALQLLPLQSEFHSIIDNE